MAYYHRKEEALEGETRGAKESSAWVRTVTGAHGARRGSAIGRRRSLQGCWAAEKTTTKGVRPDKRGRRRVAFLRRVHTQKVPRGTAASQPPA